MGTRFYRVLSLSAVGYNVGKAAWYLKETFHPLGVMQGIAANNQLVWNSSAGRHCVFRGFRLQS